MSGPSTSYVPFDELIVSLRADGLGSQADLLHYLIYKVAWTTGSELIGELGQEMKKLEQEHRAMFSTGTAAKLDIAFDVVRRVWPDFPR